MNQELNRLLGASDLVLASIEAAMEDAVDTQSTKQVLADLCVAHVHANRLMGALSAAPVIEANHHTTKGLPEAAQPKSLPLPKMQKQSFPTDTRAWEKLRPGIKKKLKRPRDFACPTCNAEAGTSCFRFDTVGVHGKPTTERNTGTSFHTARSKLSVTYNNKVRATYDREHYEAVEA